VEIIRGLPEKTQGFYLKLLANFLLFGITFTVFGATVPHAVRSFHWSYTVTGVVLAFGSIGYFTTTMAAGLLADKVSAKRLIVCGLALQALALAGFARSPLPWINVVLSCLIGMGQGVTEVVSNYAVLRIEKPGESRRMNLMHACFCVGAMGAPFIVGNLSALHLEWHRIFPAIACLSALMALVFAHGPFVPTGAEAKTDGNPRRSLRGLYAFAAIFFLYLSVEVGVSNWISEYFVSVLLSKLSTAAFMLSALWAGILVGRIALTTKKAGALSQERVLLFLAILCNISFLVLLFVRDATQCGLLAFLTGLGFSGIYPVAMSLMGRHFPGGWAVGAVTTAGGIGMFSFPFLVAFTADHIGLRGAFFLCGAANFLLLVSAVNIMARYWTGLPTKPRMESV